MTEPARREPIVGRATDEAQLAARRALVVQFHAGGEPAQRRLLGRVEHMSAGQATRSVLDDLLAFIRGMLTQVDDRRQDRPALSGTLTSSLDPEHP